MADMELPPLLPLFKPRIYAAAVTVNVDCLRIYLASLTPEQHAAVGVVEHEAYRRLDEDFSSAVAAYNRKKEALSASEARCEGMRGALIDVLHEIRDPRHDEWDERVMAICNRAAAPDVASAPPGGKDSHKTTPPAASQPKGENGGCVPKSSSRGTSDPSGLAGEPDASDSEPVTAGKDPHSFPAGANTEEEPVSIHRSKEWWLERVRAEGDSPVGAGAPMTPIATAGGREPCPECGSTEPIQHWYHPTWADRVGMATAQQELIVAFHAKVAALESRLASQRAELVAMQAAATKRIVEATDRAEKAEAELEKMRANLADLAQHWRNESARQGAMTRGNFASAAALVDCARELDAAMRPK